MPRQINPAAAWLCLLLLLFSSCGGQTVGLKIVFPDEGARQAVDAITAWVLIPRAGATCAALLDGTDEPGGAQCPAEDQVTFSWPIAGAGPERLKMDGSGARLFFAEASLAGAAILRGCTSVADAQGGDGVTVALQWIDSGCTGPGDCPAGWYCHDPLHQCLPCSSSNPAHCGSTCTSCETQRSDKACIEGACGCETDADCGPGTTCGADNRCTGTDGGMDGDAGVDQDAGSSPAESTDSGPSDGCTPNCSSKCGGVDDGCGGTCNTPCPQAHYCKDLVCSPCVDDGHCGQGCVDCTVQASNTACVNGACGCFVDVDCPSTTCDLSTHQCNCVPNCAGRACGPDPSGCGSCGSCLPGQVCTAQGQCCTPACTGRCGGTPDGCGGTCVGACSDGQFCDWGYCTDCIYSEYCGSSCTNCASSLNGFKCVYSYETMMHYCGCTSARDCSGGRPVCSSVDSLCTDQGCTPTCATTPCDQDDGCGAPCGCPTGHRCATGGCMLCEEPQHCGDDCVDCTLTNNPACVDNQAGSFACGCSVDANCNAGYRCQGLHCVP